jgi:hypothetical protein
MNRVLSLPHTPLFDGCLEPLKLHPAVTVVTNKGMIRFELPMGPVEMRFSTAEHQLAPGTEVFVWWKGGGFVCAPTAELRSEAREAEQISERVASVRAQMAHARAVRRVQAAAQVDILLDDVDPMLQPPQQPLLGATPLTA